MAIWALEDPTYQPAMRIIESITNANPAVVITTFNHDYQTGLIVRLKIPVEQGMEQANNLYGDIEVINDTSFSINIDTTGFDTFSTPTVYTWDDFFRNRATEDIGGGVIVANTFAFNLYGLTVLSGMGVITFQWGDGNVAIRNTSIDGNIISAGFRNAVTASPYCSVYETDFANVDTAVWGAYVVGGAVPPGWAWLTGWGQTPDPTQPRCGIYFPTNYADNIASKISQLKDLWLMPSVYPVGHATPNVITTSADAIRTIINALSGTPAEDYFLNKVNQKQFAQVVPIGEVGRSIYQATENVLT